MKPHVDQWIIAWENRKSPDDIALWNLLEQWLYTSWQIDGETGTWRLSNIVDTHSSEPKFVLTNETIYQRVDFSLCSPVQRQEQTS